MLQLPCAHRAAASRPARLQNCRKSTRFSVCRSTGQEAGASVTTVERPSVDEDAKVKATISALDSLLGSQDTAATLNSRSSAASSSASASGTAGGASSAAPRQPSGTSGGPPAGFKLPPLPLGGANSGASSRTDSSRRKPAGLTFDQVMGFSGLAPEVINGRAAMIGFLLAINNELRTGESVFAQMVSGGAGQALVVILAVTVASFAPAIRGTPLDEVFNKVGPKQIKEWGPFTAAAEGLNGRLAMVGLGLLLFFEGAGSTAFFLN